MRKIATVFVLTLFLTLSAGALLASVIDADFHTEFYSYKLQLPEEQSHLRSLQGMRLGVHDAFVPGLSLFIRGRVASDISKKFDTDPDFRMFGAYLEYARPNSFAIKAGRQFISAGVGGLTLDGGRLDFTPVKHLDVIGYVGTTPGPSFYGYDEMNTWKESNAYGGRIKYSGIKKVAFGVSYLERNYKDNLDSRIAGFDMGWKGKYYSSSFRTDYDIFWNQVKLIAFRPSFRCPLGHKLNLEYLYRKPTFGLSNIFSVFKNEPVNQFRVNPVYRVNADLHAFGTYVFTKFKDDDNTRVSVGAAYKGQSLGGVISDGYGGKKLGLFGSLSRTISEKLQLYATGDMFNYKLDSYEDDTTPSLAASFGGSYEVIKDFNASAEMQVLSNRDYKYDNRFYLRLNYGFKIIQGGDGTGGSR
jgi:hypothetical protein